MSLPTRSHCGAGLGGLSGDRRELLQGGGIPRDPSLQTQHRIPPQGPDARQLPGPFICPVQSEREIRNPGKSRYHHVRHGRGERICSTHSPFAGSSLQSSGAGVPSSFRPLPKPRPLPDFLPELPSSRTEKCT